MGEDSQDVGARKMIPPEKEARIWNRYKAGESVRSICESEGVSAYFIRSHYYPRYKKVGRTYEKIGLIKRTERLDYHHYEKDSHPLPVFEKPEIIPHLKDLFSPCPICHGTLVMNGQLISHCMSCGQNWNFKGEPVEIEWNDCDDLLGCHLRNPNKLNLIKKYTGE